MRIVFLLIAFAIAAFPFDANAYVGPGLGLGAIGLVLGIVVSIILAIFALFWYPIKRLLRKVRKQPTRDDGR